MGWCNGSLVNVLRNQEKILIMSPRHGMVQNGSRSRIAYALLGFGEHPGVDSFLHDDHADVCCNAETCQNFLHLAHFVIQDVGQLPISCAVSVYHDLVRVAAPDFVVFIQGTGETYLDEVAHFSGLLDRLAAIPGEVVVEGRDETKPGVLAARGVVDVDAYDHPLFYGEVQAPEDAAEFAVYLICDFLHDGAEPFLVAQRPAEDDLRRYWVLVATNFLYSGIKVVAG